MGEIVVLGNGPSLKGFNFQSLRGIHTIGMNAAYRYWDEIEWYPDYYVCLDLQLTITHHEQIKRLLVQGQVKRLFVRDTFFNYHPELKHDNRIDTLERLNGSNIYFKSSDPVVTTGAFAIRYAMHLGYEKIYLLGIDCHYKQEIIPEAEKTGKYKLRITKTPASNPNYFFDSYQREGDLYHIPNSCGPIHFNALKCIVTDITRYKLNDKIEVINCNKESILFKRGVFKYKPIEEAISHKTVLISFGTRPEYIKVKSLIDNLPSLKIKVKTLFTGQHTTLIKNFTPDYALNIKHVTSNRLNNIIASILEYDNLFDNTDYVLVQGDTSSALGVALSAYNSGIKIIHLEAGLRTYKTDPYPEEMNRQMISRMANINLCPTKLNAENLKNEKVMGSIHITGNTGLDNISQEGNIYGDIVLVTMHRKDNHPIMDKWFNKLSEIAQKYNDLEFILPIHPNPAVQCHKHLLKGITVIDPVDHNKLIDLIKKAKFIISDSGGIQEEASFLNDKIIITRRTTERPEVLETHGILCPWPEDLEEIVDNVYHNYRVDKPCPFGDGKAWEKIYNILV